MKPDIGMKEYEYHRRLFASQITEIVGKDEDGRYFGFWCGKIRWDVPVSALGGETPIVGDYWAKREDGSEYGYSAVIQKDDFEKWCVEVNG